MTRVEGEGELSKAKKTPNDSLGGGGAAAIAKPKEKFLKRARLVLKWTLSG